MSNKKKKIWLKVNYAAEKGSSDAKFCGVWEKYGPESHWASEKNGLGIQPDTINSTSIPSKPSKQMIS